MTLRLKRGERRDLRVALVTEATYPHFFGGVSVWCDHLIRGLPDLDFDLYTVCDEPTRKPVWKTPDNVTSLGLIPIAIPDRRSRRFYGQKERELFAARFEEFCRSLFVSPAETSVPFLEVLRGLREVVKIVPASAGLRFDSSLVTFSRVWSTHVLDSRALGPVEPSLSDVVEALAMFDSLLRPLDVSVAPCDVVHVTANGLAILVGFAAKWELGVPLILTEHGVYLRERYLAAPPKGESRAVSALRMRFFRHLNAAGFLMADVLSPVSEFNARWEEKTGAPRDKIQVINNGVDPERYAVVQPPGGAPTISWIGRIDPLKDLETLVEAFALVIDEMPEARLRLFGPVPVGNESYAAKIASLVAERNLDGSVSFEGRLEDPRIAYRAGHVVALSSISEGLPYTLIEAMMSGCATVSTDVGGVSEVVGEAGKLVPAKDPRAFADACLDLLGNPLLRTRMALAARSRALELFTIGQFVKTYDRLYRETTRKSLLDRVFGHTEESTSGQKAVGMR